MKRFIFIATILLTGFFGVVAYHTKDPTLAVYISFMWLAYAQMT